MGNYVVNVPQRGGRKAREATLQIKKKTVTLQRSKRPGGVRMSSITINILMAEETGDDTEDRLRRILLTSEAVDTFDDCRMVLRFYELRWRIEEFHKAWKSGAGVERLRLLCAGNQRLAVMLMFVAVRLLQIREALVLPYKQKQKDDKVWNENTPVNQVVGDEEWKVLWLTFYEGKRLPKEVPTLTWLLHTIANVGGWCDSKRTGIPGWQVIWEGWAKLQDRLHTFRMTKGVEM